MKRTKNCYSLKGIAEVEKHEIKQGLGGALDPCANGFFAK